MTVDKIGGYIMKGKKLFFTAFLSSLVTTGSLVFFLAWGGFVQAQHGIAEPGEGLVNASRLKASGEKISLMQVPADNFAGSTEQMTSAARNAASTSGVNMNHWNILGSHLLPRGSATQYTYAVNGCIYISNSGGNTRLQHPVNLPDGSVIKSLDIFYNDTSASNLFVWLTRYVPGQTATDVAFVSSSGNAGWGTSSSAEVTHTVDNGSWAYSINYSWSGVTNNSLQICGIRINYENHQKSSDAEFYVIPVR